MLVLLWAQESRANGKLPFFSLIRIMIKRNGSEEPKHPTLSAFGRASTLSLGSISFGSLIVTILDMLRLILNAIAQNASESGNRKTGFMFIGLARLLKSNYCSCGGHLRMLRRLLRWCTRELG